MATLVLGLAGAAIGSTVGYASAGWLVGTMLGSMLGGRNKPNQIVQEGPRINDTRVQSSAWGTFIPIGFGDFRIAGNIIWASRIREIEHRTTERQGGSGKGGTGGGTEVTYVSYTTEVDLAIALCEGEIDGIRRIWANGKLIYDVGAAATTESLIASNRNASGFVVYVGDETQLPDPTIEAAEGSGNVSAHRGLAYVVFTAFQLGPYGGSAPPNFTFEVIKSGSIAVLQVPVVWSGSSPSSTQQGVGWDRANTLFVAGPNGVSRFSAVNGDYLGAVNYTATGIKTFTCSSASLWGISPRGDGQTFALFSGGLNGAGLSWVHLMDENGIASKVWWAGSVSFGHAQNRFAYAYDGWLYYSESTTGNLYGFPEASAELINPSSPVTSHVSQIHSASLSGYFATGPLKQSGDGQVGSIFQSLTQPWCIGFPRNGNVAVLPLNGGTLPAATSVNNALGVIWDHLNNPWVLWTVTTPSTHEELHQINPSTGASVRSIVLPNGITHSQIFFSTDGFLYTYAGSFWSKRDYTSGTELHSSASSGNNTHVFATPWGNIVQIGDGGTTQVALAVLEPLPRLTVTTNTTWADAATALCARVGLEASDIDVTGIAGDALPGYVIARAGSARSALEPLCRVFTTDVVESDDVLKFVKRGGANVATIPYADLVIRGDAKPLDIVRLQEQELPRQITFIYFNKDGDYIQASEYSRRLATRSKSDPIEEVAVALSPATAVQTVEKWLYDAYSRRNSFKFRTTRKYAEFEPTDCVTVTGPNASYSVQLMSKIDLGTMIEWEAVATDTPIYTSSAVSGTVQGTDSVIGLPGPTRVDFLDIPILRDEDNVPGFYAPLSGYTPAYRGSTLLGSDDGQNFTEHGAAMNSATVGYAKTALATFGGGNATFDERNTVDVEITSGTTLASITRAECLGAQRNVALLGDEILIYRDAVLQSGTTYRLSGLVRARLGTEMFMGTHAIGDRFVLLSVAGVLRVQLTLEQVNAPRHYRATAFGETPGSSPTRSFTSTGALLRPLAPTRVFGFRHQPSTDEWLIKWTRRGRLASNWLPSIEVPLSETTEEYSIDFYNSAGTAVVGTLTSSSQTVTLTTANQTAFYGSNQSTIKVRIYQVSASVGRGFPTAITTLT